MKSHTAKVITSVVVLFAVIVGLSLFGLKTLASSSEKLEGRVKIIESSTQSGNWGKAEQELTLFKKDWKKTSGFWAVMLDHIEIDNIDSSLIRVEKLIQTRNVSMSLSEAGVLRQYIKHIPEKESINLKNIF